MMPHRCLMVWMLLLCVWAPPLHAVDGTAPLSPSSRLWRIAAQEQAAIEQRGILLDDSSLSGYLQSVTGRLWEHVHTDLSPPAVKVIIDTRMEAFAYPNGICFLTTGMLNQIDNEDQLAMIIAHEMVHYVRQHTAQLYSHFQKPLSKTGTVHSHGPEGESERAVGQQLAAAEYQADKEGLTIFKEAGYREAEVLTLLSNLMSNKMDQGQPESTKQMENRIKYMKVLLGPTHEVSSAHSSHDGAHAIYLNRIAPALMANAQAALQRGDWDQADASVSKFLELNPNNARAYFIKGEILRRQTERDGKDQCLGFFKKALEIDPGFPLAHRAIGELYLKAGQYQMAKPFFEAYLSLAPRDEARDYVEGYLRQCQN